MLKKIFAMLLVAVMLLSLTACGEKKILHCDRCNAEVKVDVKSNMEEDWIIYCGPCNEELGLDDMIQPDSE